MDGCVGTKMLEGVVFVEDGRTGSGAEEATGEGDASGTWMVVVLVWELWIWYGATRLL